MIARRATIVAAALAAALLGCAGCMHHAGTPPGPGASAPPGADSATIALWRFDETGGVACADSGRHRLDGVAGRDTRTDFGRFGRARVFTNSVESFVFVPYTSFFDTPQLTVEAWLDPGAYGTYEDTPIACRWTEIQNEQSWLFSLAGYNRTALVGGAPTPGYHQQFVRNATAGQLVFAFQPAQPGPVQSFASTSRVPLDHWTHVAVTDDGSVVRFWIDGQLDAQYAVRSAIRAGGAPLLAGNYFDPRVLTNFSGELTTGNGVPYGPVYAYQGLIDELRVSNVARDSFAVAH